MDMHSHSAQVCRLEVVNTGRRRRWSLEGKLRIVAESFSGHRQASATARRHEISQSLLFRWRRAFREGGLGLTEEPAGLVPAVVTPEVSPADHVLPAGGGQMEILTKDGGRVIVGADVDAGALARGARGVGSSMIPVPSGVRVYLSTGVTDMRRGMPGLSLQVQQALGRDPHRGDLYVFRGRRGDRAT